mgnify:CR=1 FL=1
MRLLVYIDGASRGNPGPASVGVAFLDGSGKTVREHCRAIGTQTNNVAEYTALLDALRLARELGATELKVHSDSQLLVRQVNGVYRIKNKSLQDLALEAARLRRDLRGFEIVHVPREENTHADRLANAALDALKKTTAGPGSNGRVAAC